MGMSLSILATPPPGAFTAPSLAKVGSQVDKAVASGHAAYLKDAPNLPATDPKSAATVASVVAAIGGPPSLTKENREVDFMREMQADRTVEQTRAMRGYDFGGTSRIWKKELKRWQETVEPDRAKAGEALLLEALKVNTTATNRAKEMHDRDRPYVVDTDIKSIAVLPTSKHRSFPSGHSSSAHAAAGVLAALDPAEGPRLLAMASDVSKSRVYAGVHFPTDVAAGAMLGTYVADHVLATSGAKLLAAATEPAKTAPIADAGAAAAAVAA